ncbi:MAG: rod shape-determining protein MreD [Pseudomonadales bacterium]|nr:rod shape-determining protein MreD [Pseudomonadales bacterium]
MSALERHHAGWVIVLSFLVAALLTVLPLPDWMEPYRPEWLVLFLIYWIMALPYRIGMLSGWIIGFFEDVLEGSLLGLNALALAIVAYIAMSLYRRLRMFTPFQQSCTVMVIVGLHQLLSYWILTASNQAVAPDLLFLASAVSSAFFWPLVFVALRQSRRYFRVI